VTDALPQLLDSYGYLALFVGALLEGETLLVLAGFAAHQGYMSLPLVVFIAFVGGTLGDQVFFFIGRRWGSRLINRFPRWQPQVQRVNDMLLRYHAPLIVGVRFMYGVRIIGPIVIGASGVAPWRFVLFNVIGAAIWAPLISGIGYLFGHALDWLVSDFVHYEFIGLVVIVAVAALVGLVHRLHRRR
jgi:membrane protein DedA with SNARE-associated domain